MEISLTISDASSEILIKRQQQKQIEKDHDQLLKAMISYYT